MRMPRLRRRWVVLGIIVVLAVGVLRLLYQPLTLVSYSLLDPQTMVVVGMGAPGAWTHIDSVAETQSTITISISTFTFEPFPHTDLGGLIEVPVPLSQPLNGRTVVDGSTGQEVPEVH